MSNNELELLRILKPLSALEHKDVLISISWMVLQILLEHKRSKPNLTDTKINSKL
jgi:hypothetical protein